MESTVRQEFPLFGCPTPDVGSQGVSPFLFFGFGGFRIKPHFWSWIESDFLPTLFCQVFPRASSCSSSFDPRKSFLTLLGTLQKFLKSPSSRALAVFLKGQHHPPTSFDRLWFLLNGNPPASPSLSFPKVGSLEKGSAFSPCFCQGEVPKNVQLPHQEQLEPARLTSIISEHCFSAL